MSRQQAKRQLAGLREQRGREQQAKLEQGRASRQQPSSQPATSKAGSKAAEPAGRPSQQAGREASQCKAHTSCVVCWGARAVPVREAILLNREPDVDGSA